MRDIEQRIVEPLEERAGSGRRLLAVVVGLAATGFGASALWWVPDNCQWAGWLALGLFVPVGCAAMFLGVRGRATDLRELSGHALAAESIGAAIAGTILALLSVLM